MAESEDPTNPSPEEPKPTEPKSMAARTEPSEGEATTVAGEEGTSGVVSKGTRPKPPSPEAKPTGKAVKKGARKKKEDPTPVGGAAAGLSVSAGGDQPKV